MIATEGPALTPNPVPPGDGVRGVGWPQCPDGATGSEHRLPRSTDFLGRCGDQCAPVQVVGGIGCPALGPSGCFPIGELREGCYGHRLRGGARGGVAVRFATKVAEISLAATNAESLAASAPSPWWSAKAKASQPERGDGSGVRTGAGFRPGSCRFALGNASANVGSCWGGPHSP